MNTYLKSINYIQIQFLIFWLLNSTYCYAEFSATITGTTDYISRGYSKNNDNFAGHANIDYEHSSGLYLGASVITVDFADDDFSDRTHVEIIPYLGWSFKLSDHWRFDTQWARYLYDGRIAGQDSDYNEFYLILHYRDILTLTTSFSEDFYNQGKFAGNYELSGRYPLTQSIEFSSSVGYSQVEKTLEYDYLYWNMGLTYYYHFVALDFRYVDAIEATKEIQTNWQYEPEVIDPSFIFSISLGF